MLGRALSSWLALVLVLAAGRAVAQPTVLLLHSQPGEYVGAGGNWTQTPADGVFVATRNVDNGVSLRFENIPAAWWYLDFSAPVDAPLTPGVYENAVRYPFQDPGSPGLSISGNGRGCGNLTGRFTVLEIVYGAGDTITRFAANFEQHCDGQAQALFGSIRYNASPRAPFTVTVSRAGTGSGAIGSFPLGIDCGTSCSAAVADGLILALSATPAASSGFAGWSGDPDCADGVIDGTTSASCVATFVTCQYTVSPSSLTGSADGGTGQLNVSATSGCPWTPVSSAPDWLFVDGQSRSGSQPAYYTYLSRGPFAAARSASITVGTATFTLTQPGQIPQLLLGPSTLDADLRGGTYGITVWANVEDVPWTASSNASWLSIPSSGTGAALLTVAPNPFNSPRTGTVVIQGVVVTVRQQANGPPGAPVTFTAAVADNVGRFTWGLGSGGTVDSYRLEAGLTPGSTALSLSVPSAPTDFSLPGVPAGRFFVRLLAVNQFGVSPATEDVELVVGANGQSLPAPPRLFLAGLTSGGQFRAEWLGSPNPGEVVTGYVLEAGTATGRTDVTLPVGTAQQTTIASVPPGAYFVRVRAVNGAGAGPPTREQLVVSGNVPAPPGTPENLSADVRGSTVTLQWTPSGVGTAARYRFEVGPYRGATSFTFDTAVAVTTTGFAGVPSGRYFLRVRGVNAQGAGPASPDVMIDVP